MRDKLVKIIKRAQKKCGDMIGWMGGDVDGWA